MLERYLHIIGWKNEGRWDNLEVAFDVAVISTTMWILTSVAWFSMWVMSTWN